MSCVVRNVSVLTKRVVCLSLQSVRYYPRWTHRTPLRVIESEPKRKPKASWRLEAEKEIVRTSTRSKALPVIDLTSGNDGKGETIFAKDDVDVVRAEDVVKYSEVRRGNDFVGNEGNLMEDVEYMDVIDKRGSRNHVASDTSKQAKVPQFVKGMKRKAVNAAYLKQMESALKLGVPLFEKIGSDDTKLSQYVLNSKSEKMREKSKLILLEGKRLIDDALRAGVEFKAIFFSRVKDIQSLPLPEKGIELYKMTYNSISAWSDVSTCPGLMGFAKIQEVEKERPYCIPLTVICDNVRDPGNLGAILRTCAAAGCECVVLTKGCVDLWNPKVLRAGAGTHFRMKIYKDVEWDDVHESVEQDANVFVADSGSQDVIICDEDEDEGTTTTDDADDRKINSGVESQSIPLIPYYAFNFGNACSLVLIVGGETEGISQDAFNFMYERHGIRLNVPLSNNVESLNSATALGVIAFEMKKQFLLKNAGDNEKQISETDDVTMSRTVHTSV